VSATDLECSGVAEVAILSLDATPESHCMEKVEETKYMSPEVHVESIQTCPESLKANVPQTTIGTCTTTHERVAFEGTAAPDPRASPEKQLEPKVPQFESSTKGCMKDLEVLGESRRQRDDERLDDVPAEPRRLHDREQVARKMHQVLANSKARRSKDAWNLMKHVEKFLIRLSVKQKTFILLLSTRSMPAKSSFLVRT